MKARRLLVIEDDVRVSRFICNVATRLGLKCVAVCVNGNIEAAYQESDPDVVFLDPRARAKQSKNVLRVLAEQHTHAAIVLSNTNSALIWELEKTGVSLGLNMSGVLPDVFDVDILKQEFITLLNSDEQVTDEPDAGKDLKLTGGPEKRVFKADLH